MRVVVVGTSGSGKSTFATALASAMQCSYVELDRLYWGPGWTPVPLAPFEDAVRQATQGECWVADGNYSSVRDILWPRATHIVWLNYNRRTVFPRVFVRTLRRIAQRTTLSHGNVETFRAAFLSHDSILLWSVSTFAKNRRKFAALRDDPRYAHLQWTEIRRPEAAQMFIESQMRSAG
ncbi:MAG TPA: hypothetical protein VE869_05700 [Gemmatimonas sp.]|nr:hypothetical protein [Gemmatimonas sp.]